MRTILILAVAALTGCASVNQHPNALYDSFGRYRQAITDGSVVTRRAEFFAPSMLEEINVNSSKETTVLMFGGHIPKEYSHYEKVKQGRGCLTVNGYEDGGDPTSLFVEYKSSGGVWLISSLRLYFQDKAEFSRFFDKALCPQEAQEEITAEFERKSQTHD